MLSSVTVLSVSADYTAAEYDIERAAYDYNTDGTVDNTIDNTKAKKITETEDIFSFSGQGYLTTDFFLSYDFNFYTENNAVPGEMTFGNTGSDIGPKMSYDSDGSKKNKGQLVTQTGNTAWQGLGAISPDTWYTIEFEGVFLGANAHVDCSLYKYDNGVKTLVTKTENMNLRNFSGTSNKKDICRIYASNICIDNVKLVSTHPNEINITSATDEYELSAGSSLPLSYSLARNGQAVTNTYAVSLALYDEANENLISEDVAHLTTDNILITDLEAEDQTITVRATTTIGEKELTGTKQIKIKAVNIENEKFDEVVIEGPDDVKAGTTAQYTFTAKKKGADVTASLTDNDFEWSIYSTDDLNKNNNKAISLTGGKTAELKIDDSVIAQRLNVRVSTKTGLVYGSKTVNVTFSDKQTEEVLTYNACEDSIATASRVPSIDGSSAYATTASTIFGFGARSDYVLTEFDVRFTKEDSGIYFERGINGGEKWNTSFYLRGGTIQSQTGSTNWSSLPGSGMNITTDDWLHFEVLYKGVQNKDKNDGLVDASCIITKYNADGTLDTANAQTFLNLVTRNGDAYGCIDATAGVVIDNVKVSVAAATEIELDAARTEVFAGESVQFTANAARNGLPIKAADGMDWEVLDESGLPIIGDDAQVKISSTGLLTVDPLTPAQKITVKVSSASGEKKVDVQIKTSELFEIKNIGVNEEKTKITKLYVDKRFNYNDEVTFIIAIYNDKGALTGVTVRQMYGDALIIGENELSVNLDLPSGFNPETDKIQVMTWTTLG